MPSHTCPKCGKIFKQKGHLSNHLKRKRPCDATIVGNSLEEIVELKVKEVLAQLPSIRCEDSKKKITITNSSYDELKVYYNTVLNVDKKLVKTSNDEPTPIECVEEMVNKIPEYVFKKSDWKWLDPCCGCGNFALVVYHKLLKYHSSKYILENMLYFNDLNEDRINVLRQVFETDKYKLNITTGDYLEYDDSVLYDVIMANPPYAKLLANGKRASKNHNLIGLFISKSFTLLNERGLLLYITPDNWMSKATRNTLIQTITSKQILHLNIHLAKRYFPKVGSSFTWYLIENTPYYKDITIEGKEIKSKKPYVDKVKSMVRDYIPLYYTSLIQSILSKTVDNRDLEKFVVETSSDLHKYTKRDLIEMEQSATHPHKLHHTPKQTVWASRAHKYQDGYKVFIGTTSYYTIFVDNCGMTQSIAFIRCISEQEANKYAEVLQHPLYKFINNICRFGNFNNIRVLQSFPKCSLVGEVYSKFGITKEEQDLIEKNV